MRNEDSNQPAYLYRLIRDFGGRLKKPWTIGCPQGAQEYLPYCANAQAKLSPRWTHVKDTCSHLWAKLTTMMILYLFWGKWRDTVTFYDNIRLLENMFILHM